MEYLSAPRSRRFKEAEMQIETKGRDRWTLRQNQTARRGKKKKEVAYVLAHME